MSGLSVRLWNGDVSCCLVFDSVSSSLVDTLLTVLTNHGGVGQAGKQLLRNSERIVMGVEEEALENIGVASKTPRAIVMWMETFEVNMEGTEELYISKEPELTEMENTVEDINMSQNLQSPEEKCNMITNLEKDINCIEQKPDTKVLEKYNTIYNPKKRACDIEDLTFMCPYCDHTSRRKYNLEKLHMPTKHPALMVEASEKEKNEGETDNVDQHVEEGSGEEGEEEVWVGKKNNLVSPILNSMNPLTPTYLVVGDKYKCMVCELLLSNRCKLLSHINIFHTPRHPPLKCTKDFCQETFVTKYQMEQHRVGCSFTCTKCGKVISKCGVLVGHLKRCTGLLVT